MKRFLIPLLAALALPTHVNANYLCTVDEVVWGKSRKLKEYEQFNIIAFTSTNRLDEDGKKMPLSSVYSARVPLLTGYSESDFTELTSLLLQLRNDDFMNQVVTGIHQRKDGKLLFALRKQNFKVMFGKPENIKKKFQNFKAFYQKAQKDTLLSAYRLVDLQFGSQVVATKR